MRPRFRLPDSLPERPTVREAAKRALPLDGSDAQALEGALAQCERELGAMAEENTRLRGRLAESGRAGCPTAGTVAAGALEADMYRWVAKNREQLGQMVREVWMIWAREQPNPKPSWLVPWEDLGEPDREVDRRIGEFIAQVAVEKAGKFASGAK